MGSTNSSRIRRTLGVLGVVLLAGVSLSSCALGAVDGLVADYQKAISPPRSNASAGSSGSAASSGSAGSIGGPAAAPTGPLSAQDLATRTERAVSAATSVHVSVKGTNGGQSLVADIVGSTKGDTFRMAFQFGPASAEIIQIGGSVYVKANKAFWDAFAKGVPSAGIRDKWLKKSASSFGKPLDISDVVGDVPRFLRAVDLPTVTEEVSNGVPVQVITQGRGSKGGRAVVNATTFLPERLESPEGTLVYTDWNAALTITAPPAGQVISG